MRASPYRNQIDYICITNNLVLTSYNSRSYGGMRAKSDHKLAMTDSF